MNKFLDKMFDKLSDKQFTLLMYTLVFTIGVAFLSVMFVAMYIILAFTETLTA